MPSPLKYSIQAVLLFFTLSCRYSNICLDLLFLLLRPWFVLDPDPVVIGHLQNDIDPSPFVRRIFKMDLALVKVRWEDDSRATFLSGIGIETGGPDHGRPRVREDRRIYGTGRFPARGSNRRWRTLSRPSDPSPFAPAWQYRPPDRDRKRSSSVRLPYDASVVLSDLPVQGFRRNLSSSGSCVSV